MLNFLPKKLIGIISVLTLIMNTLFWTVFLFPMSFLKVTLRFEAAQKFFSMIINHIAKSWISFNNFVIRATRKIDWSVSGLENLRNDKWYLVLSNHQSWTDIVVLQKIFNRKIPFLKFFLKKELIWVPLMGFAWWALDFPFMKRYSASFLEKHPQLKGKDIEITKKACAKFRHIPVSIMNFVEGTRFTQKKHDQQQSPFPGLLKPKSGGIGFTLSTMGEQLTSILNVTIAYPGGPYTFWNFLCGKVRKVLVDIEELPVTRDLLGDYINDPVYRERFQTWLNGIWKEKSMKLDMMLGRMNPVYGAGLYASPERVGAKLNA